MRGSTTIKLHQLHFLTNEGFDAKLKIFRSKVLNFHFFEEFIFVIKAVEQLHAKASLSFINCNFFYNYEQVNHRIVTSHQSMI